MLSLLRKLFGGKEETTTTAEAPYKVETPAPTPVAEQATQAVVESIAPAKKPRAKKPAQPKATKPKAPRKPKAPKK